MPILSESQLREDNRTLNRAMLFSKKVPYWICYQNPRHTLPFYSACRIGKPSRASHDKPRHNLLYASSD